jgi:hypothetical protein
MKSFNKHQPKDGDIVMSCGHGNELHAYKYPSMVGFTRPDGSKGRSEWLVVCQKCHDMCEKTGRIPNAAHDVIWKGNEPEFYVNTD